MTNSAKRLPKNAVAGSAKIEKLRQLVGEVGAVPASVAASDLEALRLLRPRALSGAAARVLVLSDSVNAFAEAEGLEVSGPYAGPGTEDSDDYYLFTPVRALTRADWPHRILLRLPPDEVALAERQYSAWLDQRGATFAIESDRDAGIVHVRLASDEDAASFTMDHGGSWVGPGEAARLLEMPDLLTEEIFKPLRGLVNVQPL